MRQSWPAKRPSEGVESRTKRARSASVPVAAMGRSEITVASRQVQLRPHLAIAETDPFIAGQFVQAHGAARADFVGADANFGTHAKLATVGKPRRGIPIDCGRIHFPEKLFR